MILYDGLKPMKRWNSSQVTNDGAQTMCSANDYTLDFKFLFSIYSHVLRFDCNEND